MNAAATRQDLQAALDRAKSSIMGTMFSRSDAQTFVGQLRASILQDLHDLHAENQMVMRSSQNQHAQILVRISALEQNIGNLQQIMAKLIEQQGKSSTFYR